MLLRSSAFFKLADIIPLETAVQYLKDAVVTSYGKKGQNIVDMNHGAIDAGINALHQVNVPAAWADAADDAAVDQSHLPEYIRNVQNPVNRQEGNNLSVKDLEFLADGTFPTGSAAYEKRGIAINVPEWDVTKCIQCNQCAFVCPHAAIRPVLTTDAEKDAAPAEFTSKPAIGAKGLNFTMAISAMDCSGCGNCVNACPAKEKALVLKPFATQEKNQSVFDYAVDPKKVAPKANPVKKETVKGSQFEQPLLEFSGACAGCGETPYAKLITQLFGDRMMIANATGCSSIWGASAPAMPYTTNAQGHGPAWANSLFEDNAEFGLGMFLGAKAVREIGRAHV